MSAWLDDRRMARPFLRGLAWPVKHEQWFHTGAKEVKNVVVKGPRCVIHTTYVESNVSDTVLRK
jgi:hypothetical protein